MSFELEQRGFDEQGRRLRRLAQAAENPGPLLPALGAGLADLWRHNIDAGPNERWEAGPSLRALREGGTTLFDTGEMYRCIEGNQTGPDEVTIGGTALVGRYNLLALHEFGVDTEVTIHEHNRLRSAAHPSRTRTEAAFGAVQAHQRHQYLPRRPTSPFDWDAGELTPEAQAQVQTRVEEYVGGLTA